MPWIRTYYKTKKQKVWLLVNEEGAPILDARGMGQMRYTNKDDATSYTAHPAQLIPMEEEQGTNSPASSMKAHAKPLPVSLSPKAPSADACKPIMSTTVPEELLAEPYPQDGIIEVYTDGACQGNPGPCSAGVVIRFGTHYKELRQYLGQGTNNIGELTAIALALKTLRRHDIPVRLHTDSSYSIGVLTQGWKAKVNRDLIQEIKTLLAPFQDLKMIKVKGHSGIPLNERVDQLAVLAIEEMKVDTSSSP